MNRYFHHRLPSQKRAPQSIAVVQQLLSWTGFEPRLHS